MTETLDKESRNTLIEYRLNRAKETLKEAALLRKEGFCNAAVNRLYYACFYAVQALLLKHSVSAQTHSGVKAMFSLHFIKTGVFENKYGRHFNDLFNKRHSGDYDDFAYNDEDTVDDLTPKSEDFIEQIEKNIKSDPNLTKYLDEIQ